MRFWGRLTLANWTQVSDRCPLGYLFKNFICIVFSSDSIIMHLSMFSPSGRGGGEYQGYPGD